MKAPGAGPEKLQGDEEGKTFWGCVGEVAGNRELKCN
jgi:hypothetical protein